MRALNSNEVLAVSGGLSVPPEVQREMEQSYINARNSGLTHSEALDACWGVGVAASAGGNRNPYSRLDVEAICNTAVENYIRLIDKTPAGMCEAFGGTWDTENRRCVE